MHTIVRPTNSTSPPRRAPAAADTAERFRKPRYDFLDLPDALKLTVFVPGVEAAGVDVTTRGPDLTITARKTHFVRVNFAALHLENAQRDYQLRLRLGRGFDYAGLEAEIADGVLAISLPKKPAAIASAHFCSPAVA
ncbi:MAG TPA: Hsp20/alpha crystallin family protein [Opitutaceae bacterium]|nr:Hsp20/alpha crystallin family protein [Opitutaceae bacterium]